MAPRVGASSPYTRAKSPVKAPVVSTKKKKTKQVVRVGAMTPDDLASSLSEYLGGGWRRAFVSGTGISPSTMTRYLNGKLAVPQYVVTIVEMIATLRGRNLPLPVSFSLTK